MCTYECVNGSGRPAEYKRKGRALYFTMLTVKSLEKWVRELKAGKRMETCSVDSDKFGVN